MAASNSHDDNLLDTLSNVISEQEQSLKPCQVELGQDLDNKIVPHSQMHESSIVLDEETKPPVALDMGSELQEHTESKDAFASLANSGIGISKALYQGTRLHAFNSWSNHSTSGLKNQYLNIDPKSLLSDKITHISGKTLDITDLLHDLKELDPDLIKAANQESLGGFSAAANDLLLYRKLEELGGEQYRHISIGQLRALIKKSIPNLTDKAILECYSCFKSCIKNDELKAKVAQLAQKYQLDLEHTEIEAFLFTDESSCQDNEGLLAIRKLVVETYCAYEDEILKIISNFDIKNSQFSKAYDEITFYYYLIAHKSHQEHDYRVYEALVKLKNHIELFILMRGSFIKPHDFALFSDSEIMSEVLDDYSIFTQHSYHSAKELAQLDPCGMHFCYLESVLNMVISNNNLRSLLFNFIKKFGQLYVTKARSKFFNPTMEFEFDFIPSLLSYVYGIYCCQVGSEAFYEASGKVEDSQAAPLFFYDIFSGTKVVGHTREYELAMHKFKDTVEQSIQEGQFSDELKEWSIHIMHHEAIYSATQELLGSIITCGHPISKDENYLNDQVAFEIIAFYSKYLINIERKHLYAKLNHKSADQCSDLWLLGDNGRVPLIPGMPALTAFLIGRAFTYGELIEEQNNTWGFSALTYADFSGNYLASTYLAHYYQALFDNKLNAQGQLFFLYHMRSILAFHLGMTSIDLPWSSLKLYHNYDFHILHHDVELYFKALKRQDKSWERLFKNNPTLEHGSKFEGRQMLLSTVFGTIVGNSLIYLCDLIEQNPKFGDFYHNSLLLLTNLLERCLKAEYTPVGCFAVYRLLTANLSGDIYGVNQGSFSKFFLHSTTSTLLFNQLFPKNVKSTLCDELIDESFESEDIANMFLQVGMLSPAHREQGYNLLNHHLSSYKGNFAPLTEPYLDELYRTSAALGNGNSLSYLSESAHALGHEAQSELYALMGARLQTGHLYKKLSHYFIKNDMHQERRMLSEHMFFMHRPYGFYDSYLVLKEQKDRLNEAHTFLFYAAYMSVPEAIAELEALEKAHLFTPLPFVVYLKYLEQLAYTKVEALLTLRLLSQSGGILPVNSFYFMKYLERNHAFFSNSMLKKALLETGQLNFNLGSELYSIQSSSCSELFKSESDYLSLNSYDMEGNFATYHQLLERNFTVEHFNAHNVGDSVVQETVTKLFDSLVSGKSQLERAICLNWRMADSFPSYLQAKADALNISIESEFDFATIDSVMSSYRGALDTYPLSLKFCLGMDQKNAHILDNNKSLERIFHSLVKSEIIPNTLETMYVCALNSLRGRGRPNPQFFLNFCRYLANSGDSQAIRYSHMCMNPLNMVPYGDAFNECMVTQYEEELEDWSKHFAKRYFDGDLLERLVESFNARQERDFILNALELKGEHCDDDDNISGYGTNLNSIIYSDSVGELSSVYGERSADGYQEIVRIFKKQENRINALIYNENQDIACDFIDSYIARLQKLSSKREVEPCAADDNPEHWLFDVYGPLSSAILKAQHFDLSKLFIEMEPWLKPEQKITLTNEHKSTLYIKAFIDFAFFMKSKGWNITQSLVCSRNGWQLNAKEFSPKRSYASLLAKDLLSGASGARERFLYYVQSHGFKYHINTLNFHEDAARKTALNFVNNVLQLDLNSPSFQKLAQSLCSEDLHEFKELKMEMDNGFVPGRPRFSIEGLKYDFNSGYALDPEEMVALTPQEALQARDELKAMAAKLNELMGKEQELKLHYFTCSDRLFDDAYGSQAKIMRAQLERILGVDNIERLLAIGSQWLSYSFYDQPNISFKNMLSMLGISCAILPYRLIKGVDTLSESKILQNSTNLNPNVTKAHKDLKRALAEDLNDLALYGVSYDERAQCWNMSKEQLCSYARTSSEESLIKSQESLMSSYNYALYQEDQLCVNLAKIYLHERQGQEFNELTVDLNKNDSSIALDSEHIALHNQGHLSMEERELLECLLSHHEYHGPLFKRRYKSECDKICSVSDYHEVHQDELSNGNEQERYHELSKAFLSSSLDEVSNERSQDESIIYQRLQDFLGSQFSCAHESKEHGPNSLLGLIYSKSWSFKEADEEQYTRPHLFHEEENPLHVYIYALLNLRTTNENYPKRLAQEAMFLDALYSQGYFFGCNDLIDCAFKNTVYESYRYRFERDQVANEISTQISNLAGSILKRLLQPEEVTLFYQSAIDETNEVVQKVSQSFSLPFNTPKRYVLNALINYSDEQVTKHLSYYKALISATQEQLQSDNYEVLLDDSLPHQAFYDLFKSRGMIARAPNVMHWLYLHDFKGMDIGRIEPQGDLHDMRKLYYQALAKSIKGDSFVNNHEQVKVATSRLVDSPELGYQNVKLAKFHSMLTKEEDCRRLSYIEQCYGIGLSYENLDSTKCNSMDAMTLKLIKMQDVLHEAGSHKQGELSPFAPEYIFAGLSLGDDELWQQHHDALGRALAEQIKERYGYCPILDNTLGAYRYSVDFDSADQESYESYFREHPLQVHSCDKDWVDRLLLSGNYKEALSFHNFLLDQLENSLQEEGQNTERNERLACYECAQSLDVQYFVYDEDNYSDVKHNIIMAQVGAHKEVVTDPSCMRISAEAGMYVPMESEDEDDSEQALLDDKLKEQELYYSGYDEYDYSGYDNYGDCYQDACSFDKKTPEGKSKKASAPGTIEPYEHMSLDELLGAQEDLEPMIMSYDQMEAFSQFLAEHNINPMDIDGIADALVQNHFEILDQKGLSNDDIARTMRENGFDFDEQSALNEIDQHSAYKKQEGDLAKTPKQKTSKGKANRK